MITLPNVNRNSPTIEGRYNTYGDAFPQLRARMNTAIRRGLEMCYLDGQSYERLNVNPFRCIEVGEAEIFSCPSGVRPKITRSPRFRGRIEPGAKD